jgi:hypothetical protein
MEEWTLVRRTNWRETPQVQATAYATAKRGKTMGTSKQIGVSGVYIRILDPRPTRDLLTQWRWEVMTRKIL